ncbi:MAG: hypothetical protein ACO36I_26510 [Candidatus Latescibacterota bacterium]|jgi:hypothetical protein
MTYIYLLVVLHLVLGVACACIANETRHNVKSWYIAGTLLGGLALIALVGINFHKQMPAVRS